jgi:hypothetical protein
LDGVVVAFGTSDEKMALPENERSRYMELVASVQLVRYVTLGACVLDGVLDLP